MAATKTAPAEVATAPAHQIAAAIRNKEISSRELLELYLDRIERLNAPVNAVVTLDVERARAAAQRADEASRGARGGTSPRRSRSRSRMRSRSTASARRVARSSSPITCRPRTRRRSRRSRHAGAVVFGKTNVPRWSGDLQTYNDIFGTTNNPWSLDRVPGGSSGGAASAVACGFTSFELGTDIGGSVRIPSHCCGVFGLKPSFGVVPQRGYLDHVGGGTTDADINVFGPIARSAADLDLLLGVLAGPEPERTIAWRLELPAAAAPDVPPTIASACGSTTRACRSTASIAQLLRGAADRLPTRARASRTRIRRSTSTEQATSSRR